MRVMGSLQLSYRMFKEQEDLGKRNFLQLLLNHWPPILLTESCEYSMKGRPGEMDISFQSMRDEKKLNDWKRN